MNRNEIIEYVKILKLAALKSNKDTALIHVCLDSFNYTMDEVLKLLEESTSTVDAVPRIEVDKAFQDGYMKGYRRAMLDYGLEDDKENKDGSNNN